MEYYLESVQEYSEGKIRKSEPEPRNGNVNTVYFVNQARGILESVARDCKCLLSLFELPALNNVRQKYTFTN